MDVDSISAAAWLSTSSACRRPTAASTAERFLPQKSSSYPTFNVAWSTFCQVPLTGAGVVPLALKRSRVVLAAASIRGNSEALSTASRAPAWCTRAAAERSVGLSASASSTKVLSCGSLKLVHQVSVGQAAGDSVMPLLARVSPASPGDSRLDWGFKPLKEQPASRISKTAADAWAAKGRLDCTSVNSSFFRLFMNGILWGKD